ncbi:hypothetical protein GALMADRAFT_217215 [Galerina marginata CBS 339.88]|uniref:Uncharacterized protein n=1 Tax=Galerina marginata (strain CBS 339.88) TaxID=685588 RepID=A0A067S5L7_GALM3|nr:hypothetical protein GALMADRAFT_217215 [Galerina marginata CBS 339.88]
MYVFVFSSTIKIVQTGWLSCPIWFRETQKRRMRHFDHQPAPQIILRIVQLPPSGHANHSPGGLSKFTSELNLQSGRQKIRTSLLTGASDVGLSSLIELSYERVLSVSTIQRGPGNYCWRGAKTFGCSAGIITGDTNRMTFLPDRRERSSPEIKHLFTPQFHEDEFWSRPHGLQEAIIVARFICSYWCTKISLYLYSWFLAHIRPFGTEFTPFCPQTPVASNNFFTHEVGLFAVFDTGRLSMDQGSVLKWLVVYTMPLPIINLLWRIYFTSTNLWPWNFNFESWEALDKSTGIISTPSASENPLSSPSWPTHSRSLLRRQLLSPRMIAALQHALRAVRAQANALEGRASMPTSNFISRALSMARGIEVPSSGPAAVHGKCAVRNHMEERLLGDVQH